MDGEAGLLYRNTSLQLGNYLFYKIVTFYGRNNRSLYKEFNTKLNKANEDE